MNIQKVPYNVGYSSHGKWSTLEEIRKVELERGNVFPENLPFSDDTPAIWLAFDRRDALVYLAPAQDHDNIVDISKPLSDEHKALMERLVEIELLSTDQVVNQDRDGGYLVVRPEKENIMEKIKCVKCDSTRTIILGRHNNRRKKIPIYLFQCENCKKRFIVKGEKEHYNHKGNIFRRKPGLFEKDMHMAYPDMRPDETVEEYWHRKFNLDK